MSAVSEIADVFMTLYWTPDHAAELSARADGLSSPDSIEPHLTREALFELVAHTAHGAAAADATAQGREAVKAWLIERGIEPIPLQQTPVLAIFLRCSRAAFGAAFGDRARRWLTKPHARRPRLVDWPLPPHLAGYVQGIQVLRDAEKLLGLLDGSGFVMQNAAEALGDDGPAAPDADGPGWDNGLAPEDIARIYDFPSALRGGRVEGFASGLIEGEDPITDVEGRPLVDAPLDGRGETIALLLLDAAPDMAVCRAFWEAHGIERSEPKVVHIGPAPTRAASMMEAKEAAMGVQWAGAMAPGAEIVCYVMDRTLIADKWSAWLMGIIHDAEYSPTIAVTAWLTPERDYYASYGSRIITGLLDLCALLGISVVAAAGNWGCYDGVPRTSVIGVNGVPAAPWPSAVFPACEERVLAVGGTMIAERDPLTELAWSGPLPPGFERGGLSRVSRMAGGGGFSTEVPIPDYQSFQLPNESSWPNRRLAYFRGPHAPPVLPFGRGVPDVSLAAVTDSVQRSPGRPPTARGYRAVIRDQNAGGAIKYVDFAGGTSVAAPIWAALLARLNQARRAAGLRRLGCANPMLYAVADEAGGPRTGRPFRDIVAGRTDVTLRSVAQADPFNPAATVQVSVELPGFQAANGWDPATGLGVPRGRSLCRAVVTRGRAAVAAAAEKETEAATGDGAAEAGA